MAITFDKPWSDNPNAPQIPYLLYFAEKSYFTGAFLGAIFYGIVIVLFFRCMNALFDRTNGSIKWPLVTHTTAMFSFVTVYTAMYLNLQSISFIDNREYPGADGGLPPGPYGYQQLVYNKAVSFVPHVMFMLNTWLADGLLLYRCYIVYSNNYRVVAFPCLMYLASFVMGVVFMYYQISQPTTIIRSSVADSFDYPFFTISISLNLLLTLMIVARLILHRRNIQNAFGVSAKTTSGFYMAVITILIESCALYAISFILFIVPWSRSSFVANIFFPVVAETQTIAPLLIIERAANRRALTSETIVSGIDSIRFKSQAESASDDHKPRFSVEATMEFRHSNI